jgi:hypothetical protein
MNKRAEAVLVFSVWWATWTLLDTYLIPYTPWSELAVLSVAAIVCAVPPAVRSVRARMARGREILKEALDAV